MKNSLILAVVLLAGCSTYRPLVDQPGPNYEADLSACQKYADTQSPATSAVLGAVAGAGLSALLATVGGDGIDRGASTRIGAVIGAVSGAASGGDAQIDIIRRCLQGRGYRVLQ